MPEIGQVLGDTYRLVRLLGQGGWGAVYEAEHLEIGKRAAVKVLRSDLAQDSHALQRFVGEARAAAAIRHRSIIDVYDVQTSEEGSAYLIMEFLEGESLGERLEQSPVLEVPETVYICCQILSALDATHNKGIVHRDLKPDNIFLVETGLPLPDVKILDFGVSKILYNEREGDPLTCTGALVGTPHFMAPEQAAGQTDLDHRLDLYAVGVILYRCLTGELPFRAPNMMALVQKVLHQPVVPPRELRPDLPDDLERVVLRAMAREREQRYREAAQMLAGLRPFLDESAVGRVPLPASLDKWEKELEVGRAPKPHELDSSETLQPDEGFDGATLLPDELESSVDGTRQHSEPSREESSDRRDGAALQDPSVSKRRKRLLLAGAFLLLVVPALVFFVSTRRPHSTEEQATVFPEIVSDGGEGSNDPSLDVEGGAPPPESVTITLEGVPEGATVFFDNAAVDGNQFRVPRSDVLREVRVELAGYVTWRRRVSQDENRSLRVSLVSETDAALGPSGNPRGGDAGDERSNGRRPGPHRGGSLADDAGEARPADQRTPEPRPTPREPEQPPPTPAAPPSRPRGDPGFDQQFPGG